MDWRHVLQTARESVPCSADLNQLLQDESGEALAKQFRTKELAVLGRCFSGFGAKQVTISGNKLRIAAKVCKAAAEVRATCQSSAGKRARAPPVAKPPPPGLPLVPSSSSSSVTVSAPVVPQRSSDEAKQEPPSWDGLGPLSDAEKLGVLSLSQLGFSLTKSLVTLRRYNGQLEVARMMLFQELSDLQEAKLMDDVALVSESTARQDKKRAEIDEEKRLNFSDVLEGDQFSRSLFLDARVGLAPMREVLAIEKDGVFDLSDSDLREICVKLLVLEAKSVKWYGIGAFSYIYTIIERLRGQLDEESLKREVAVLETTLYEMPGKSGDMPQRFLDALKLHPTSKLKTICSSNFRALAAGVTDVDLTAVEVVEPGQGSSQQQSFKRQRLCVDLT